MPKKYVTRREEIPGTEITLKEIQAKIAADNTRRISFLNRKKILQDNIYSIIDSELRKMFTFESYSDMRPYIDVTNNLAKRIVKEISTVYKTSPDRAVTPKASDKNYSLLTGCEEGFDIDQKFARANFLLNGLNDLIIQVAMVGEFVDLNIYTPDMVVVFENPDNPTEVDALLIEDSYRDESGNAISQWIFWSPTRHFIIDKDFKMRTIAGNEEGINPFRDVNIAEGEFYPFVFAHSAERENCFWDMFTGNDLYEGTKLVALQNTFRNFMVPMQFKQISVKTNSVDQGEMIKSNQIKSPLHVFQSNGDISVLDWQSNIMQLGESIQNVMLGVAGNYGISSENFKLQAQATSGFARRIAKERLNELRQEQIKVWRSLETLVFDCVQQFSDLYSLPPISENAKIQVDFASEQVIEDPQIEMDILKQRLELGLISLYDVIRAENSEIETDEQAEEFLSKNLEVRNSITQKYKLDFSFLNNRQGEQSGQKQNSFGS